MDAGVEDVLSITEVAAASGLRSSALRYYEKMGLIASSGRSGGRRQYPRAVLRRLGVIGLLQDAGFTIGEIALLVRETGSGWRPLAEDKLKQIDAHLDRVSQARALLTSALGCRCASLERCELVKSRRGGHREVTEALIPTMGRLAP